MLSGNIDLYKSLFRGREDLFAVRLERNGKATYFPSYDYDPYQFRLHKMKGGTLQTFQNKTLSILTNNQIEKHLNGEHFIGIYPLLKDNTSWFIAADFDRADWIEDCQRLMQICEKNGLSASLERSRSGKGGHVWLFFEQPYPAVKSRKIMFQLMEQIGLISAFDKNSSFDRVFPNQDYLSGKGFGNLIALPLNKLCVEQSNNCFISPETYVPYQDQWRFLEEIKRIPLTRLDQLYSQITHSSARDETLPYPGTGKLIIVLKNSIKLTRSGLTLPLINFLKEELNFPSSEYIVKKKLGKNTWGTEQYFKFIEEFDDCIIIPKGMAGRLIRFCRDNNIEYSLVDKREKADPVSFTMEVQFRDYQKSAIEASSRKDMGVIVAPPGTGKTVIGLKIIADKRQPALIIVHRKQLADQWIERIESFLGIPKNEIGRISQGRILAGHGITIALIQSLSKIVKDNKLPLNQFGTIIVDECHHIPAETYRDTIGKLSSYYLYGLTATPFRKYNDGKLIFIHLGEIISEIKAPEISSYRPAKIIIRNTELDIPFNPKIDRFETLSKVLVHDSARNRLILKDVIAELNSGKKVIILTERKEHIDTLNQFLKQSFETITLSGDDNEKDRILKSKLIREGSFQAVITTGQFFGEGVDIQNVDRLFLVYPFSFKGKLIQYIGRVQRSEISPVIYDYRDIRIDYLNKMFLKRNVWYRKLEKEATLFDEPETEIAPSSPDSILIKERISVSFDDLDFRYGSISFRYQPSGIGQSLEFEIENEHIRPEFEVLKAYFSKILKKKTVTIDLQAEFQGVNLVSQMATSPDLDKINEEIIEIARFRFVSRTFFGNAKKQPPGRNLMDIDQLQSQDEGMHSLYESGEKLLDDLLKHKDVIHYRQLRYLAEKHQSNILKIRFVLNPFSFVFLLSGDEQYHIVLETLDTREATYIWHVGKNRQELRDQLKRIDQQLSLIRNEGRQAFLESQPINFSRILHDYSDEHKGFIQWRDLLQERLI